ncbi:hypothetical protein [Streptomyces sp. DHE17-7]|uniref:hypothetical protein n=1 Tax=Streptomyces sp. DHE17-7 TaxID=2759949 RepID=UPI000EE1EE0B|nr:hypothetical protein [Streptomyces sp. DHE17-7]MBJ6623636.1 hypothetical protein [Streptomyces sp. DHE17-7]RIH58354.1 hypothetical protein D3C59_35635 [Streptomyces sp. SHP22-7]RIH58549.1 hypothetical protein D3C59_34430 [Streptomyces sp. SHP22-7]
MTELFGINPVQGGATGLVILVVVMILTGRLVPRSYLEDARADRDYWRAAHTEEVSARQAERDLTNELLEVAQTADRVLMSLPRTGAGREEVNASHALDQPSR